MISGNLSIMASETGYCHVPIRRSLDAGKINPEKEKIIVSEKLENERKKVQPIYNAQGEIVEYDKYGRHLDIID